MKTNYTKAVTLIKGESEIRAHLSRGEFVKHKGGKNVVVDGEFGRSGEHCANNWHGDYESCKRDFFAYVGEKVLDGYSVAGVEVFDTSH